jgi:hypothetical protein
MVITLMPGEVLSVEFFESYEPRALVIKYDVIQTIVEQGNLAQTFTVQKITCDTEWPDNSGRVNNLYSSEEG